MEISRPLEVTFVRYGADLHRTYLDNVNVARYARGYSPASESSSSQTQRITSKPNAAIKLSTHPPRRQSLQPSRIIWQAISSDQLSSSVSTAEPVSPSCWTRILRTARAAEAQGLAIRADRPYWQRGVRVYGQVEGEYVP